MTGIGYKAFALLPSAYAGNPGSDAHIRQIADERINVVVPPLVKRDPNAKGPKGDTGATGPQGETGATGATDATGPTDPTYGCTDPNLGECKVFVTTTKFNGALRNPLNNSATDTYVNDACTSLTDSIERANCICSVEGSHRTAGRWRAWLSTSTVNAKDNIGYNAGVTYIRQEGGLTIAVPGQLLTGTLTNPITELPEVESSVYTGTNLDGTSNQVNCNDWTNFQNVGSGIRGIAAVTDQRWTNNGGGSCVPDSKPHWFTSLICFEAPSP